MDRMIAPVYQQTYHIPLMTLRLSTYHLEMMSFLSRVLAPRDDELPMGAVTHLTPVQTPMIATSHEEISGTSGMMDEPIVRDAHHRQGDPQIQEEVQDVHAVDTTHTGQSEEMESQLLEIPVVEQIAEVDRWMEHLLPGSDCMDEDVIFSIQDDHSTSLDTSIWDLGADGSSRLSVQEDTSTHTGYSVIQGEIAPSDGVQSHTGVPSSTVDSGQFSTSSYAEDVLGILVLALAGLTLAVRGLRWHLSMTMIRSHTT
jgi:hypothetical protein